MHLLQLDGLPLAVLYGDDLGIRPHFVVGKCLARHAEIVIALGLYQAEVVLRGDARVYHHEHLPVGCASRGIGGDELVHHVGQRLRVCGVALQYGAVADEAVGVDGQCQHQELAVRPLLLRAAELRLPASVLAALEVEVGQVKEHDAVRGTEQVVRRLAEILLYLLLFLQEPVGHAVHLALRDGPDGKVKQFAYS